VGARKDMEKRDFDCLAKSQLEVGNQEVGLPCSCTVVC
jgi:hypothetical protein